MFSERTKQNKLENVSCTKCLLCCQAGRPEFRSPVPTPEPCAVWKPELDLLASQLRTNRAKYCNLANIFWYLLNDRLWVLPTYTINRQSAAKKQSKTWGGGAKEEGSKTSAKTDSFRQWWLKPLCAVENKREPTMQNVGSKSSEQWALGTHWTGLRRGWSVQGEGRGALDEGRQAEPERQRKGLGLQADAN